MLTRNERERLEREWSSDDRSMAGFARLLKGAVLSIMIAGLLWIAGTGERADNGRQATAGARFIAHGDGTATRLGQQAYDERRAQWEGKPATPLKQAASQ